jgi:acetolactate decarboxylase
LKRKSYRFGKELRVRVSNSLWSALQKQKEQSNESIDHIVQRALAEELDVKHNTLFEVSTSSALVQGVYDGCMTVKEIQQHGNFGLGTFDALDGEGIMYDGVVWHAKGDGSVEVAKADETAPFWVATHFKPEQSIQLKKVTSWGDLCQQIDNYRQTDNIFVAICVKGVFSKIKYRVACHSEHGVGLASATDSQAVFEKQNCQGALIGFWSPLYAKSFNIPGYHLHLLSDDHKSAGHVFELEGVNLNVELNNETHLKIALPETEHFLNADLSIDPLEALRKAEGSK